jgi:hypothetical protein
MIRAVLPPTHHRIFGVSARWLTKIFIACDILSFLVQASGSSVASSEDWTGHMGKIGTYILMAGLSFQVAAFAVFLTVFGRFDYLATKKHQAVPDAPAHWRRLVVAVYISSASIMVSL